MINNNQVDDDSCLFCTDTSSKTWILNSIFDDNYILNISSSEFLPHNGSISHMIGAGNIQAIYSNDINIYESNSWQGANDALFVTIGSAVTWNIGII